MLFRTDNQSETNNIFPSSKCCYPEERCASHGLHSIHVYIFRYVIERQADVYA